MGEFCAGEGGGLLFTASYILIASPTRAFFVTCPSHDIWKDPSPWQLYEWSGEREWNHMQ